MKAKTVHWVLLSGLVVCAAAIAAMAYLLSGGAIMVTIRNATGVPLSRVMVKYEGGSAVAEDLGPGEEYRVGVAPTIDSGVVVEYTTPDGTHHSVPVDCYIENDSRGELIVELQPRSKAKVEDRIRPPPL